MTLYLAKNLSVSSFLLVTLVTAIFFSSYSWATSLFNGDFSELYAQHVHDPYDEASNSYVLRLQQTADLNDSWSAVLGARASVETLYLTHPKQYPDDLASKDSQEVLLRDAYLQYRADHLLVRVGNQQVVWGEAFGLFYADIVNPKDLREGSFGDFSENRFAIPIVNAKLIFGSFWTQAILVPQPQFSKLPLPGSDFAFPFQRYVSVPNISIHREQSLPWEMENLEVGNRTGFLWNKLDFSLFYFNYFDRNPYYLLDSQSTLQNLVLDERHSRVESYGATASLEANGYVLRFEGLMTKNRVFPKLSAGALDQLKADDQIYVAGVDFPTWNKINWGLQWSQNQVMSEAGGLFRSRIESLASLHLQYAFFKEQTLDLIYNYATEDGGQRFQMEYLLPLSNKSEIRLGVQGFDGPESSEFGQFRGATRAYLTIKAYFQG